MPGSPRTPTRILELRGSRRAAVRRKRGEPTPEPGEPPMPAWVADDAEARDEWRRVAPHLVARGLLAPCDMAVFGQRLLMRAFFQRRRIAQEDY